MATIYLARVEGKDQTFHILPIKVESREPIGREMTPCCIDFYQSVTEWHIFYVALFDQALQQERPRLLMRAFSEHTRRDIPFEWRSGIPVTHCPFCGAHVLFQTVMTVREREETIVQPASEYKAHYYEVVQQQEARV